MEKIIIENITLILSRINYLKIIIILGGDTLGNYGAAGDASMATSYFNNFQLQQNKLPGMAGMYGLPPFYGDFYGKFWVVNLQISAKSIVTNFIPFIKVVFLCHNDLANVIFFNFNQKNATDYHFSFLLFY